MNHESENRSDSDDKIEPVLKSLKPSGESSRESTDGQLMYAMGFAAGVAEAGGNVVSPPSVPTASNRLWQLATVAATVVAATLAFQLFSTVPDTDSEALAMNHVEASEDAVNDKVTVQKTAGSPSKQVRSGLSHSFVESLIVGRSKGSAFSRRGQILASAESVNLDEALERFVSVGSQRNPVRQRNEAGPQGFSPRSAVEDLLNSNEFQGL